jgi:hexulose-6-phosphate isomerase
VNRIGIMQGRLLPVIDGRIQAFPWQHWPEEFTTAQRLGFDSIEFVFEGPNHERHPLLTADGVEDIRRRIEAAGVGVSAVCADYFMSNPLFRGSHGERRERLDTLAQLVAGADQVGAGCVEIPCVDASSLASIDEENTLLAALAEVAPQAQALGIRLVLETDLPPERFRRLLERAAFVLGANYDTGNSASLGYDPRIEIPLLGDRITNVHVKDRARGGSTVPLGDGATDFEAVFDQLAAIGYTEAFILQTARDPDDVGVARRYLGMVRQWVHEHFDRVQENGTGPRG